jgi:serine/threonine protein kinase
MPTPNSAIAAPSDAHAKRCPLPSERALAIWRQLLEEVASLHTSGRLHGDISAETASANESLEVHLPSLPEEIRLAAQTASEASPPELQQQVCTLPAQIDAAAECLQKAGINCDPRRIDVYQLGAVLCRMLTGQAVAAYLQSPRIRGKVPASLREVLDGALGYDPSHRFQTIDEIQAALRVGQVSNLSSGVSGSVNVPRPSALYETPAAGTSSANHIDTPPRGNRQSGSHLANAPSQPPPERLGPYRILERIGGGGMGDVFKAYEESLDRYVAIKVLPADLARHEDFVRRFRSEALAVAKLIHPNVVQIHTFGEDAGRYYFAMQFIRGESLADCLNRRRLTIEETLSIVEQALAGLAAAHKRGLIHRDVKPGNILLDHDHDRALLADFGLVKALEGGTSLTTTGIVMGTVDYLPPEQARGQQVDARADLYSLGVVMYQMLSGRLPFTADSPTTMIFKHAYEQPARLAEIAPEVPQRLAAIVTRLMAKNPDNRYQSAEDVLTDIQNYRCGKPPATSPRLSAVSSAHPLTPSPVQSWEESKQEVVQPAANFRDRLFSLFRRHAPQLAAKLENTTQQVDGAIRQYERRHDELAALLREAEDVTGELAAQVASHQEAAREAAKRLAAAESSKNDSLADQLSRQQSEYERTAADFAKQLAGQRSQNERLQSQLAQVAGTLQKLRSQRDILQARLQSAQAQIQFETDSSTAHNPIPFRWTIIGGLLIAMGFLTAALVIHSARWRSETAPSDRSFTPSADLAHKQSLDDGNRVARPRPMHPAQSERLGGSGGGKFAVFDDAMRPLLGIKYALGDWKGPCLKELVPIFDRSSAPVETTLLARDGYAVGGLIVDADDYVRAVRLIFMKLKKYELDPTDRYESDWIGTPPTREPKTISGEGQMVLGLFGGKGIVQDSVGLILGHSGKFAAVSNGSFEIYVNGNRLAFSDDQSETTTIHPGDVLVVRVQSMSANRAIRLEFVSEDKQFVWPIRRYQFRTLSATDPDFDPNPIGARFEPAAFDAATIDKATMSVIPGRADSSFSARWDRFHLPKYAAAESIWAAGQSDSSLIGTVITPPLSEIPPLTAQRASIPPGSSELVNASDPEFSDRFPEQGTPFTGDLSGQWKLHFPNRYVYPVTLRRVDTDHYQLDSLQYLSGGYAVRGNRVVMDRPDQGYINVLSKLWPFQWRIDDDHLTLIGEPQPARFGGYSNLGATLERESAADKNSARITGRFCFVSKGDFELYLNRRRLTLSNNRSSLIDVCPDDSIVAYVGGSNVDPDFRMTFVSDDGKWVWPARRGQFRALPDGKPQLFSADSIAASQSLPDYGQSDNALAADWSQLKVPTLEGDWLRSGSKDDPSPVGTVIQPEFFSSPAGAAKSIAPDAQTLGGHHYKFFSRKSISWQDARDACHEAGGKLACPESDEEEALVLKLAAEKPVWLGGYADSAGKEWKWLSGNKINIDRIRGAANPPNLYLATAVNKRRPFEGRTADGTFRMSEDGAQAPAFWPNIQGYICQWDE